MSVTTYPHSLLVNGKMQTYVSQIKSVSMSILLKGEEGQNAQRKKISNLIVIRVVTSCKEIVAV